MLSKTSNYVIAGYICNFKHEGYHKVKSSGVEITEAREDTKMIPVVPFLCKKVHLRLERCGGSDASRAPQLAST